MVPTLKITTSVKSSLDGEDDWVIVEKQRVNILISPLPNSNQPPFLNPESLNIIQMEAVDTKSQLPNVKVESSYPNRDNINRSSNMFSVLNISKKFIQPKRSSRLSNIPHGKIVLNWMQRATLIERKLCYAGGVDSWLLSLGLGKIARIFKQKNVNQFQLVNLTMKKLKEMGVFEVGTRRKLMHAIECICHPHWYQGH